MTHSLHASKFSIIASHDVICGLRIAHKQQKISPELIMETYHRLASSGRYSDTLKVL